MVNGSTVVGIDLTCKNWSAPFANSALAGLQNTIHTINYGLVFIRPNGNEAVKLSLRFHLVVIE